MRNVGASGFEFGIFCRERKMQGAASPPVKNTILAHFKGGDLAAWASAAMLLLMSEGF